jgi:hypothetical protein
MQTWTVHGVQRVDRGRSGSIGGLTFVGKSTSEGSTAQNFKARARALKLSVLDTKYALKVQVWRCFYFPKTQDFL